MPPAPRLPSATGTTRARGLGFSTNETKALLRSIEKYLPIGGLEWDTVVSEHEGLFPLEQRTKEALKRKFTAHVFRMTCNNIPISHFASCIYQIISGSLPTQIAK